MTSRNLGLSDLAALVGPDQVKFWIPGLILSVASLASGHSERRPQFVQSFLPLISIAVFFVTVRLASSLRSIESDGWLVGPFPAGNGLQLLSPNELADANWNGLALVCQECSSQWQWLSCPCS